MTAVQVRIELFVYFIVRSRHELAALSRSHSTWHMKKRGSLRRNPRSSISFPRSSISLIRHSVKKFFASQRRLPNGFGRKYSSSLVVRTT